MLRLVPFVVSLAVGTPLPQPPPTPPTYERGTLINLRIDERGSSGYDTARPVPPAEDGPPAAATPPYGRVALLTIQAGSAKYLVRVLVDTQQMNPADWTPKMAVSFRREGDKLFLKRPRPEERGEIQGTFTRIAEAGRMRPPA